MDPQIYQKFFWLVKIAVGRKQVNNLWLTEKDWEVVFEIAMMQGLVGVVFDGIQKISNFYPEKMPPLDLLLEWIGQTEKIKKQNKQQDEKSAVIKRMFDSWGYESCILKGQGVARLYSRPDLRQSGDIDIWLDGKRSDIIKKLQEKHIEVSCIDYVNCHALFFEDTEVEVHFRPTWMYNPFINIKVQKWIESLKDTQMANTDKDVGFSYPTVAFNLVFSLIHIYRHVFQEGIGLRQLMDYYYILIHSSEQERNKAYRQLKSFDIGKFSGAVMYIMRRVFDIDETFLLCEPNQEEGKFLLAEIMRGGNFGYYDDRNNFLPIESRMKRGVENIKHNIRFLNHYPSEVMWAPAWKTWHWCWRKWKGFL